MSDTYTTNGQHEAHDEQHASDVDTIGDELEQIAQIARARRAKQVARLDQLIAERQVISNRIRQLVAEMKQSDKLFGTATTEVVATGRKPANTKGAKR